jgi:hypothetical protein
MPAFDAQLGAAIVAFAYGKLGAQEGSGECFDLADHALTSAGASTASDYGTVTPTADYVWGVADSAANVQPGYILQFKNVTITTTTTTNNADGSSDTSTQTDSRPHHTAIVESMTGGVVTVLEQNVDPGGRVVQEHSFPLSPTHSSTNSGGTTVQIDVTGTINVYRPQRK